MLRMQTLGGLAVLNEGRPLGGNAQQPRRLAVLAILARAGEGGVNRDRLAALLWGDMEEERARRSLNQALYALRQDLGGEDAILGTRDLRLNPDLIRIDLIEFENARRSGALEEAARLYTGPFLGDFHLPGAAEFARWAEEERTALAADYRGVLEAAAAAASERNDRPAAVLWWRRLAALDPTDAPAAQGLMRALAAAGDLPAALRQAEIFEQLRAEELALPPDPAVRALAERLRQEAGTPRATARPAAPPPAPSAPPAPPLPAPRADRPSGAPAMSPETTRRHTRLRLWLALAGLAVVGAGGLAWYLRHRAESPQQVRLAVLPFENQGNQGDDYFADGIADDLRGKLSALPGLEVVASSSSNEYRDRRTPLASVARDLGVQYLLVGKVRWRREDAGISRVNVSPELIRIIPGHTPTVAWQQPFDAALTDVFRVQADIAARVAEALDVVLGDSARRTLGRQPTRNLAAYDEFLKGEAAAKDMKGDQADLRRAIVYFQHAVALDSTFTLAWGQLSRAQSALYSNGVPAPALGAAARAAAERARALGPDEPRVYLAAGDYYQSVNPVDNRQAMAQYEQGLQLAPNNVDLLSAAASMEASLGRWEEAAARLARASRLDPRSVSAARRQATVHLFLRNYPAADTAIDRAITLAPTNPSLIELKVMIALAQGRLDRAQRLIQEATRLVEPERLLPFFASYQDLYWVLSDEQQRQVLAQPPSAFDGDRAGWALVRTELYQLRGDAVHARAYADTARLAFESQLREAPGDGQRHALLGLALAYLGRKVEAEREGLRGLTLLPIGLDGYQGPYVQLQLARIYILGGDRDKALDQLAPLLEIPYYLSPGWLRLDPTFAPLRSEPRFQQLAGG